MTLVEGNKTVITGLHVQYSNIHGLKIVGNDNLLDNSLIEDVDWLGTLDFPALQIGFDNVPPPPPPPPPLSTQSPALRTPPSPPLLATVPPLLNQPLLMAERRRPVTMWPRQVATPPYPVCPFFFGKVEDMDAVRTNPP